MADVNLNENPYYDDYTDTKDYQKILFKPSIAVQARELTQLQSIQEQQVARHGKHIFQEGSIVEGMEHSLDLNISFVRVNDLDHQSVAVTLSTFNGKYVRGETSGCEAFVVNTGDGTEGTAITSTTGPKTLFLKYTKNGTDNISRHFSVGETLVDIADSEHKCICTATNHFGYSSQIVIDAGIIFAKNKFLNVTKQTAILDRYSELPSVKIGYKVTGSFIDSTSDSTLLDPSQGAPNFNAPGADRLQYNLILTAKTLTTTDLDDFVELFEIEQGIVARTHSVPQYAELRKEFARRTFDESGNYTVNPFTIRLREHLNDGSNGGRYLLVNGGNSTQLVAGVEPGTAYVRGFKYETVITENLNIKKATDTEEVENQKIAAAYGNYVLVQEYVGAFPFDSLGEVSLRDGTANAITNTTYGATALPGTEIGQARVRAITHHSGTPGSADCQYRLYLFDIRMTGAKEFADVRCVTNLSSSSDKYLADTFLYAGGTNSNILFEDGDVLLNEDGLTYLVHEDSISGEKSQLKETGQFHKLLYQIPQTNIKTIRDATDNIETSYKFRKEFDITFSGTGAATLATGVSSETFPFSIGALSETNRRVNFIVIPTETKAPFNIGQPIDFSASGTNGARSITISTTTAAALNVNETLSGGMTAKVICTLTRANAKEATKTLIKNKQIVIDPLTHSATTVGPWGLAVSDCFKLNAVYMSPSTSTLPTSAHTNITTNFELDTGQRDNFYDHGQLKQLANSTLSITGQLLIDFDYFTHDTSQGIGYLSVDSYPIDDTGVASNTIKTWEIPIFNSGLQGKSYDLRDVFDCRPRRTDLSTVTNPAAGSTVGFDIPAGGSHMMHPNEEIDADLLFYLPRKDKIVIDKEGNFNSIQGIARHPIAFAPQDNEDSLTIALVKIPPYPSLPPQIARANNRAGVQIQLTSNQRYTMKDIGQLEQRIKRMEYYTALSLLEKDTADLQITNAAGLDRFKNGILVDPFTGHGIGDITNKDYKAAIDMQEQELRPTFSLENVPFTFDSIASTDVVLKSKSVILALTSVSGTFVEDESVTGGTSTATAKITNQVIDVASKLYCDNLSNTFVVAETITGNTSGASGVIATITTPSDGNLVTLPYTHKVYTKNPYASKERNCVAELVFHWTGELQLSPNTDNWVDTENRPDVQVNFDNNMDAWETLEDAWETHWNDWETVFTGREEVSRERLGGRLRLEGARGQNVFQEENERVTTMISQHQTRSGVQLDVTPEAVTHRLGSKVIDVSIIPFIRSRVIAFSAIRMKPNTKVYAFFDGEDVNAYCTPTDGVLGGTLVTDAKGAITGTFTIPNSDAIRFRIGDRKFRLADAYDEKNLGESTEYSRNVSTAAEATYTARGILQNKEDTVIATTRAEVQTINVTDARINEELETTVNNTGERFVGEVANQQIINITNITHNTTNVTQAAPPCDRNAPGPAGHHCRVQLDGRDPIAQTFIVLKQGGMFVSKLDLFFSTKSATLPITLQIREVENGYPSQRVLPHGSVTLNPVDINISADASAATPFYFESPVYLSHSKEYCFVLLPAGNNPDYHVWVSEIGQNLIGTTQRISEQPYVGVLFTSANNRTWTARQTEDIKFYLHRCLFDVGKSGTATFTNGKVDYCSVGNLTGNGNFQLGEVITGSTSSATGTVESYSKAK